MLNKLTSTLAIATLALAACAVEEPSAPKLDMQETESGVVGEFQTGDYQVDFSSEQVAPGVYDTSLELNGMELTMTMDQNSGVLVFDGWAADNGQDVQILAQDRQLLKALLHELNALGTNLPKSIVLVRVMTDHFTELGETSPIQVGIQKDADRSGSLCGSLNSYKKGTHDGWGHSRYADNSTTDNVYISMHSACSGADGTYFHNGSWTCYEPDHDSSIEYAYGNCFGRCGGSCGSGTVFTWDCLDHDQCVRTGHSVYSSWCSDELAGATWDAANGSNCL